MVRDSLLYFFASGNGDTKLVQLLLENSALTDIHDINDSFPLLLSIVNDHDETSQLLLANSHLTTSDWKRLVQVLSSGKTITDPFYEFINFLNASDHLSVYFF